jgi:hypothetical protein
MLIEVLKMSNIEALKTDPQFAGVVCFIGSEERLMEREIEVLEDKDFVENLLNGRFVI